MDLPKKNRMAAEGNRQRGIQGEEMISLLDQHVDSNHRQSKVVSRIRDFLQTGQHLDEAPESVLRDLDELWDGQRARARGVKKCDCQKVCTGRPRQAFGKFAAPTLDHI